MAEFAVVMRQAKRMCDAISGRRCHECPLWRQETEDCSLYGANDGVDYADIERRVMAWAAEHPAQRYPTWSEWQHSMFPDASEKIEPCSFASVDKFGCDGLLCEECREQPIPADIAEKLGIMPINEGCDTCKYRDKAWDEEPCVKCRNTASGKREMDGMPDLWEEAQSE